MTLGNHLQKQSSFLLRDLSFFLSYVVDWRVFFFILDCWIPEELVLRVGRLGKLINGLGRGGYRH